MAGSQRNVLADRDINQTITTLKKGTYLLKYGRRGKPKFCPFHLSSDESKLIWYSGKEEKHLKLSQVSRIIPGQRTAVFQRYPQPEKDYQSFSLICNNRSLDLICKDKDEAEVWFVGLKALISRGTSRKWRIEIASVESPKSRNRKRSPVSPFDRGDARGIQAPYETRNRLGKTFADIVTQTALVKSVHQSDFVEVGLSSSGSVENVKNRNSGADVVRVCAPRAVSSSSNGSRKEDSDALVDIFVWGQGIGDGVLDALLPKALESKMVLDVHKIACGSRHAVAVTKQGEIFSWGEESGGRLGHGVEADVPRPKLVNILSGMNFESVACGEYHSCAVTDSGELYTWGDGTYSSGLLGHGSEVSHWIPKRVNNIEGMHVSFVSCGAWHTALVTSGGQLFTFGDGSFGALGHGDRSSTSIPREVQLLGGLRTTNVSCGAWHTAAVVEVVTESLDSSSSTKLYTWGDGDNGQLGHGDKKPRLFPRGVVALFDDDISQVACGHNLTVALTTSGQVYTMGSSAYGQLGSPKTDGNVPTRVEGKIADIPVEEIVCGSYHVAILTSENEVYTWGKGTNGQLGHGDTNDRHTPTLVDFFKDKQVKSVVCGSNVTAVISLHNRASSNDHSICSSCRNLFSFIRKRHNCYNCGLVFCKACSTKKSTKASLAPNTNKPYRVCDGCFAKLKKRTGPLSNISMAKSRNVHLRGFHTPKTSRATSPASGKSSCRSSTVTFDDSKQMNDSHNHEIITLRAQVEDLTCKSRNLEAELEKTRRKLKEVTAIAENEAEKYKSAEEVIATLVAQLEQASDVLTTRRNGDLPDSSSISIHSSDIEHVFSNNSHPISVVSAPSDVHSSSKNLTVPGGSKGQTEKSETVIQDVPGVYITLSPLVNGRNVLMRVRFSRKHFSQETAEKWWSENRAKVYERHNIIRSV